MVRQQSAKERLDLRRREQELKAEQEMLDLQTEIASARARQRVYDELDTVECPARDGVNELNQISIGIADMNVRTDYSMPLSAASPPPPPSSFPLSSTLPPVQPLTSAPVFASSSFPNLGARPFVPFTTSVHVGNSALVPESNARTLVAQSVEPSATPMQRHYVSVPAGHMPDSEYAHHFPVSPVREPVGLASGATPLGVPASRVQSSDATCDAIITALSLPKPDLSTFSGDVMNYQTFISAFDFRVGNRVMSDAEKLHYLHQFVSGEPRDLIGGCLYMTSDGYQEARKLLVDAYGSPYKLASAYMTRLQSWPMIKNDQPQQIRKLSSFITRCLCALSDSQYLGTLNHPDTLKAIVQKLPPFLKRKWTEKAHDISSANRLVTLTDLGAFVERASQVVNDPVFGQSVTASVPQSTQPKAVVPKAVHNYATDLTGPKSKTACNCFLCEKDGHLVSNCFKLLNCRDVSERKNLLKEKGLCFSCLGRGHVSRNCRKRMTCEICDKKHPTILHETNADNAKRPDRSQDSYSQPQREDANPSVSCNSMTLDHNTVFHAIIPVIISRGSHQVTTYCFLDNGSNGCFLSEELYDRLLGHELIEESDRTCTLRLNTMHGATYEQCAIVDGLLVTDCNGENPSQLPRTYVRPSIPMNEANIAHSGLIAQFPQLREFEHLLPPFHSDASIGLLLGSNCELLEPLQVQSSDSSPLFAVRYRHGWAVQGPLNPDSRNEIMCNRIVVHESCKEVLTPSQVLKAFERDFIDHDISHPDDKGYSVDDRKFMTLVESETEFDDGHFVVPLPFRDRSIVLPDNRGQVMSRLKWQTTKMMRNDQYRADYFDFMQTLMEKGYCEPVPSNERNHESGEVWYLPHHGVYHPQKGKLRVVFDCSARCMGVSLNDLLLQGPDLANNLWGVLTRFRFEEVAFVADLEAMFYQIRVPSGDRRYLRFLWWDENRLGGRVSEFQMTVHIFGAVSSPSVANYVIKTIASRANDQLVKQTLFNHFYVDDCLRSVRDAVTCERLIARLRETCEQNGFRLTKFNSNNREVLRAVPVDERAKEIKHLNLDFDDLPMTRALGVLWNVEQDQLTFSVQLKAQPMTRRGVLSVTAALYDPLGFVAPVILPAKQLLQKLCVEGKEWDEPLSNEHQSSWETWLASLPELSALSINRHFFPAQSEMTPSNTELHVFCDASSTGYGAVMYLRMCNEDGNVHLCFVAGKARVVPIKATTVPKLELTSATVAVRLACMAKREMHIEFPTTYHTDSQIVLAYINNSRKRFPVFVSNRVRLIRDFSEPSQWRHVPSSLNPADDASRGLKASEMQGSAWLSGPEFLLQPKQLWPLQQLTENVIETCSVSCVDEHDSQISATERLVAYFSSWDKLRRATAIFRRMQCYLRQKVQKQSVNCSGPLSAAELEAAEYAIVRFTQANSFAKDLTLLKSTDRKNVLRKSSLYRLNPFIDERGMIRVGGRLRRDNAQYDVKYPIVLPYKGHVTDLIIRNLHLELGHAGRNHVLSSVRSKYWVLHGNAAVRRIIASCVHCRRGRGPCLNQIMADLPECRLDDSSPPFSHVGIDYFGPFDVKVGRKIVKRYGVLFACMASRAIHLELAPALDTSAFINALRRFLSRRGLVKVFYSDNGTNFVGAVNELKRAFSELDPDGIQKWSATKGIDWRFNPPSASHMGGAWERAIRTVRKVLYGIMIEKITACPDDDTLSTIFCEVENIVNSRPISTISNDPNEAEPLTPNHALLLGKSTVVLPPMGEFQLGDMYARKRWRRTQIILNLFWSRWRKEFLSFLQSRAKWQTPQRNLRVGDIVLLNESSPRSFWPLGRVTEVYSDDEGRVRRVKVVSKHIHDLIRPIHKLVLLLPVEEQ